MDEVGLFADQKGTYIDSFAAGIWTDSLHNLGKKKRSDFMVFRGSLPEEMAVGKWEASFWLKLDTKGKVLPK